MREQTIVWRNDFVEVFEQLEFDGGLYESERVIVCLECKDIIVGKFRAYDKDFFGMFFMSQNGYDYKISRIKEFAFM